MTINKAKWSNAKVIVTEWVSSMNAREVREFVDFVGNEIEDTLVAKCEAEGHCVVEDMCGKPEHRYCCVCYESLPNAELPARQVKVDETTDRKSVLPSESLGSGSIIHRIKQWLTRMLD